MAAVVAAAISGVAGYTADAVAQAFPREIELPSLNGMNGFAIYGIDETDYLGVAVSAAGDVNGDGIDDVIIGAARGGFEQAESAYVVFGAQAAFPPVFDLSTLDGSNGFVIKGFASTEFATAVSGAGDINGDGFDDLIIGAPLDSPNGVRWAGASYVVFGRAGRFPASLPITALNGSNGFALQGGQEAAWLGGAVAGAGDVNADGIDDIIVGANDAAPDGKFWAGESYVLFGTATGFPAAIEATQLNGSNGFVLKGVAERDHAGSSVAAAGDLNGDGVADFAVGAFGASPNGIFQAGETYVVFGTDSPFPAEFELSALNGTNGFVVNGIQGWSGSSVSGAGDVNSDGVDDLIIGAPQAVQPDRHDEGEAYVLFGRSEFAPVVELSTLDGNNGFVLGSDTAIGLGTVVSGAGDVNGDGVADVITCAQANAQNVRESYVVFGSDDAFPATVDVSSLDGTNGFLLEAGHYEPGEVSVSDAGDFNGDGVSDVIVGDSTFDLEGEQRAGASFVVFGCRASVDADCDSRPDDAHNCVRVANVDQRDTDQDGIGNACDGDFNQDCMQNFSDLAVMKQNFFLAGDLNTDMNGDGFTNFVDLGSLKRGFFQPPGPSGVPNLCDGSRRSADATP